MPPSSLPTSSGSLSVPREGGSLSPRAFRPDYKVDPDTGCWVWQKWTFNGYGRVTVGGVPQWAHRAYYERANGPLPAFPEAVIDHLCRNTHCVNPAHLEAVTPAQNIRRGTSAKLTMDQAREIRRRLADGATVEPLMAAFGVSEHVIYQIAYDLTWREDRDAPRVPIRPERYCPECNVRITEGARHRVYCCAAHRRAYNVKRKRAQRRAA